MSSIRIATFNVLFARGGDGPGSWSERVPLVARAITRARPDVIGCQEVFPSMLDGLRLALCDLTLVPGATSGPGRWFDLSDAGEVVMRAIRSGGLPPLSEAARLASERRDGEHLPIAYRSDRLRVVESGAFWISATPDRRGSTMRFASTPFMVHWARFERVDSARPLIVFNGHLGHAPWRYGTTARVVHQQIAQATGVNGASAPIDHALIGDFNTWPGSPLIRALTSDARLVDAAAMTPERAGPAETFHWGTGSRRFSARLDYVLSSRDLRPTRAEVIDEHEGRLHASDHRPLVVEFDAG